MRLGKWILLILAAAGMAERVTGEPPWKEGDPRVAAREKRDPGYYRVYENKMMLLPLADRGINGEEVILNVPDTAIKRPLPEAEFGGGKVNKPNSGNAFSASFEFRETSGVDRVARIRTGIPVAAGVLYRLPGALRVTGPEGKEIPAQFSATGYWTDGSVKWVLVQFALPLKAKESKICRLEYLPGKPSAVSPGKLACSEDEHFIIVDTGKITARIDKRSFKLISEVRDAKGRLLGAFDGVLLTDGSGGKFSTASLPPERIVREEEGPEVLTFKITGSYADENGEKLHRYTTRLRFFADSAVVQISHKHLNDWLVWEFSDLDSLTLDWLPGGKADAVHFSDGRQLRSLAAPASLAQWDENAGFVNGDRFGAPLDGAVKIGDMTIAVADFARRYPKALTFDGRKLTVALLPKQPSKEYGRELPGYLQFPFCEGKYRIKWGMAFTEELTLDFGGGSGIAAEATEPVIAVIDRDYLASTRAIPGVLPKNDHRFDRIEKRVGEALKRHLKRKRDQREFGFLNYGDWFGERGRNWGNNEYDLAHGLFSYFYRSGYRSAAVLARAAARHQADVDTIQAYADRYVIGANAEHAVGHTGMGYQWAAGPRATWSYPFYRYCFSAGNGHTWTAGMIDGWFFNGDPVVMDSVHLMGEHMLNFMLPDFKTLGGLERSAGWSVIALVSLYRATGDRAYLDGARIAVDVALKEQNFEKGGAWAHKLGRGHDGGNKDAFGNAPFLVGILLESLRQFEEESPSPEVRKSMASGANWLKMSYHPEMKEWPYTASWDGKKHYEKHYGWRLSGLCASGMLAGGDISGDPGIYQIGSQIVENMEKHGFRTSGKSFAQDIVFLDSLINVMSSRPSEPQGGK